MVNSRTFFRITFLLIILSAVSGCNGKELPRTGAPTETLGIFTALPPEQTLEPGKTLTSNPQVIPTVETINTDIPLIRIEENTFLNPAGCLRPSEDYSMVEGDYWTVNQRTYQMLEYAASLYQGEINLSGNAITQGSYTNSEVHSFGTHSGGGAVDISVMREGTYTVLYADIYRLVRALRVAGFAAWFRDFDEVYPGSPVHIHAIAIGDEQLSNSAIEQLTGEAGYFKGLSGLFDDYGNPGIDRFGGPTLCDWMVDLYDEEINIKKPETGYSDIQSYAQEYIPNSKTSFLFDQYKNTHSGNYWYSIVNGAIVSDILLKTGKLPDDLAADFKGKNFAENFQIFSESHQTWFEKIEILESFKESKGKLYGIKPGDVLLLNIDELSTVCDFKNIFLVTRLDNEGGFWTIGVRNDQGIPEITEIDLFSNEGCMINGINGDSGFVWYRRISSDDYPEFIYLVEPGDTLMTISRKYECDIDEIITLNQLTEKDLWPDQELIIP